MIVIQLINAFLDLAGIIIMGMIGGLLVYGSGVRNPNSRIFRYLDLVGLGDVSARTQIIILGLLALILLSLKSIFSIFFTQKTIKLFFRLSARLSVNMISKIFSLPVAKLNDYSIQNSNYITTTGAQSISGLLSNYTNLLSDFFLCFILVIGIGYVDLKMTIFILIFFGFVITTLYFYYRNKATNYGIIRTRTNVKANELFYEVIQGIREISVSGRIGNYLFSINEKISASAENEAKIAFIPFVNKYVLEIILIFSLFAVGLYQFSSETTARAVSVLTIFLAASSRLVPAMLRIQTNIISVRNAKGVTEDTVAFIKVLNQYKKIEFPVAKFENDRNGFNPNIKINNLKFKYMNADLFNLDIPNLEIKSYETIALVGKSGSGKSTLVDLILGLNLPTSGDIKISGLSPQQVFLKWPGEVAYVPQAFHTLNGTFKDNLCMGIDSKEVPDEEIHRVLAQAQLTRFVESLPQGINTQVGDRGTKISGGQRQRLSIARALLTRPSILVLDEATSALDSETENELGDFLISLSGKITLIVIAHRLSTIMRMPRIIYMENGSLKAQGDFNSLRKINEDFNRQVELSGY